MVSFAKPSPSVPSTMASRRFPTTLFRQALRPMTVKAITSYEPNHHFVYIFENGRGIRVPLSSYETKSARKKLVETGESLDLEI